MFTSPSYSDIHANVKKTLHSWNSYKPSNAWEFCFVSRFSCTFHMSVILIYFSLPFSFSFSLDITRWCPSQPHQYTILNSAWENMAKVNFSHVPITWVGEIFSCDTIAGVSSFSRCGILTDEFQTLSQCQFPLGENPWHLEAFIAKSKNQHWGKVL